MCIEQGSWQPLLDRQGNVTARFDEDEGKWDLLWVDDQGDQLWAALDFFCPAAEDAPPPPTEDTASLVVEEAGPAPAAAPVVTIAESAPVPPEAAPAPTLAPVAGEQAQPGLVDGGPTQALPPPQGEARAVIIVVTTTPLVVTATPLASVPTVEGPGPTAIRTAAPIATVTARPSATAVPATVTPTGAATPTPTVVPTPSLVPAAATGPASPAPAIELKAPPACDATRGLAARSCGPGPSIGRGAWPLHGTLVRKRGATAQMTLRLASIAATDENQYLLVWRGDGGEEYSMSCEVEEGVRTGRPADEMTLLHPKPADLFMRGGINPRVISAASGAFHKARAERADLAAIENIKRPGS